MTNSKEKLAHLYAVKAIYEATLRKKANVVSVGIGLRPAGRIDFEPAIFVNVTHKVPLTELAPEDQIPKLLDDVPVVIQVVGTIRAL